MSLRCCHISIEESFFLLLSAGLDVSFPSLISFFLKKMRILPTFIGFSATCVLAVKGVGFLFRSLRMAVVAVRLFIEPGRFCVTLFSFSFFSRTGGDNPLFTCGPYWVIFFSYRVSDELRTLRFPFQRRVRQWPFRSGRIDQVTSREDLLHQQSVTEFSPRTTGHFLSSSSRKRTENRSRQYGSP